MANENNIGDITTPSARVAMQRRWLAEASVRIEKLIFEAKALETGNPVDVDRVLWQIAALNASIGLWDKHLPRGYTLARNANSQYGFFLKYNGSKVADGQFALDCASGWLDEFGDMVDKILEPKRPKQITGKEATGG